MTADPIAAALAFAIRRAVALRRLEEAERRAKLTVVEPPKRGGRAA
jgi:hypothetical protein